MTEKPIEITMVASEMFPFAKSGGLGDVIGALPPALGRMGHKVCVYLPAYRSILRKYEPGSPTQVADVFSDARYDVFSLEHEGVSVKLVAADELFDRNGFYGDARGAFPDNAERFARFARGALSRMEREGAYPSVIHCHDWQSALIPPLLNIAARTMRIGAVFPPFSPSTTWRIRAASTRMISRTPACRMRRWTLMAWSFTAT